MPTIKTTDLERLPHQTLAREAMKMRNRALREKNKADNFWEAAGSTGVGAGAAWIGGKIAGKAQADWEKMVAKRMQDEGETQEDAEKALASSDPRTFIGIPKDLALGLAFGGLGLFIKKKKHNAIAQWAGHGFIAGWAHQVGMESAYESALEAESEEEAA